MKRRILQLSVDHPRWVFVGVAVLTLALGLQIPRIRIDTDPENMLAAEEPARVFHNQSKALFDLHDTIAVGIVNESDPAGVFNPETLRRIHTLNEEVKSIEGVIARDVLGPATLDNIEQAGPGTIRFEWLMAEPPETQKQAIAIRDAALRLPMLRGTVVSKDGKSIALHVPIEEKDQSHRIAGEIQDIIDGFSGEDRFYIAGLPVAEDTFGVEMFVQMAISAPLAALVIMVLMWLFFRSFTLILSPMIVAFATVIMTMGALIGAGFTVHIMSSMIPIFLMPIAVVDSVHILSEFVDRYRKTGDRGATIREVVEHLFSPMLYTSLTSATGFLSLTLTPIPPVRVFGVFVALGIGIAFLLTIVVIPAYVVRLPERRLQALLSTERDGGEGGWLGRALRSAGALSLRFAKPLLVVALALVAVSGYGISQIHINDNPVRWFKPSHRIRIADDVLNRELAGTYPAYLVFKQDDDGQGAVLAAGEEALMATDAGERLRGQWNALTSRALEAREDDTNPTDALIEETEELLFEASEQDAATWQAVIDALEEAQTRSKTFQAPEQLAYLEGLQQAIEGSPLVGKTSSLADVVKIVFRELKSGEQRDYRIPDTSQGVAQTLLQYQSSHRPHDLWHLVTPDYREATVWFQLKSGDNQDMASVQEEVADYLEAHPPPDGLQIEWAGLTPLNVVWQDKMVRGMLKSLLGAFVIVFLMMAFLFRSALYGILSMVPLTMTIVLTYGLIGLVGKDYDMPVAVLSSLTLGLSVDFAIHFLERSRVIQAKTGAWTQTLGLMFEEPGRAIMRNAIVIAIGFLPLLAAPLVPYNTVGFLMAAIMAVSSIVTVILLPAIMIHLKKWLTAKEE